MSFFVRARFAVRDRRNAEFEHLVRALRAQAEDEPGTLTYRCFPAGPGSYLVLEEYTDSAAATAHNERAAELLHRVGQCAEMLEAEIYGDIGPGIREWARAHPGVTTYADLPEPGVRD